MAKVICVLGMHRSGTSCLAGTLEEAGLFLGEVSRKNPFNLKGNHENPDIMALHEAVLAHNQAGWDAPKERIEWTAELTQRRDDIIAGYAGKSPWGFKDPRTLVLLQGWLDALPDMEFAGIFRHPLAVAASLTQRNHFSLERGLSLWAWYNQRLLAYHQQFEFPLIEFMDEAELLKSKLSALLKLVGLPRSPAELAFFDKSLQNQTPNAYSTDMPEEIATLYARLQAAAL